MTPQNTTLYYSIPTLDGSAGEWGLVIGWLITPPENYGKAITFGEPRILDTQARVFFHRDQAIAQRTCTARTIPQ